MDNNVKRQTFMINDKSSILAQVYADTGTYPDLAS
jgi:hypothetical protein